MVERASLESLYTGNCIEGSNPSVSAERDLGSKRELSPFFIKDKSPVCRAICAIMKLISEVRNAPFFLSYYINQ